MRRAGLALLLLAAMAAAAWFSRPVERPRVGPSFQRPGVVEIVHAEGVGASRHVFQSLGRVVAREQAQVVFRWLADPHEAEVEQPEGSVDLLIGDPERPGQAPAMRIEPERVICRLGGELVAQRERRGGRFMLRYRDGRWAFLEDGEVLADVAGAPPGGLACLVLRPGSSFGAFAATLADGEMRRVDGGERPAGGARALWAALATLGGLLCLRSWWRGLLAGAGGRAAPAGAATIALSVFAVGAVAAAAVLSLQAHNAARFAPDPEPCALEPLQSDGPRRVAPGEPWDLGARRDGDFVLQADVALGPGAALDVLLRGSPPDRDTGLLLTLSADPELPSGLSRNLGTCLQTVSAPAGQALLAPGVVHVVRVRCEGGETRAEVDGRELATLRDWDLRAGRCAFMALRGEARVSQVVLQPLGSQAALSGVLRRWQVLAVLGLLAGLVLSAAVSGRGAAGALWAWPLAAGALPGAPAEAAVAGLGAAALLLLLTPRSGRLLATWLCGGCVLVLFVWALHEAPPANQRGELNELGNADVAGGPLPRGYVWARHPLCRRFSSYARTQRFREERVAQAKPPGTLRVAAVGSSSTYGYGVPAGAAFIEQLEARLRAAGYAVEGLNCGQPGATAERLRWFLEGVVLDFQPDVVLINLAFNDHVWGAVADERAHFAAMTGEGIGPLEAVWARVRLIWDQWDRKRHLRDLNQDRPADEANLRRFSEEPARRFAASLRDMVVAAQQAGAAVVLVAEPFNRERGEPPIAAFHAAMAELAAELDVPLVEPQARLDAAQRTREVFVDTVHPNVEGHALIAAELAEALLSGALLERGR